MSIIYVLQENKNHDTGETAALQLQQSNIKPSVAPPPKFASSRNSIINTINNNNNNTNNHNNNNNNSSNQTNNDSRNNSRGRSRGHNSTFYMNNSSSVDYGDSSSSNLADVNLQYCDVASDEMIKIILLKDQVLMMMMMMMIMTIMMIMMMMITQMHGWDNGQILINIEIICINLLMHIH